MKTRVGYTGGKEKNPTYEQLCSGRIGHTESIQVYYDPDVLSFEDLLATFWSSHSPTGHSKRQYMSAIWYTPEQKKAVKASKKKQQASMSAKITTTLSPLSEWWDAESYHQKFYLKQRKALVAALPYSEEDFNYNIPLITKLNAIAGGRGTPKTRDDLLKSLDALPELDTSSREAIVEFIHQKTRHF